jgi:hypothetical protein
MNVVFMILFPIELTRLFCAALQHLRMTFVNLQRGCVPKVRCNSVILHMQPERTAMKLISQESHIGRMEVTARLLRNWWTSVSLRNGGDVPEREQKMRSQREGII